MARNGLSRVSNSRSRGGAFLLCCIVAACTSFGRLLCWSFCSSPSPGFSSSPRSVSKVQVRFFGLDANNDGIISVQEFLNGMRGVTEKGKFSVHDFYDAVGIDEEELCMLFTVVGEPGRLRLWDAMEQDLDLGTVKKGFPHFNNELNTILPGLPRFNAGYFPLDKDHDGKVSDDEWKDAVKMILAEAKIDEKELFKRVGSTYEETKVIFCKMDDLSRVQLWQAMLRDVKGGGSKEFPLFKAQLKLSSVK